MDTNYINLKRRTDNEKKEHGILILVCVTDMWYIYADEYMPGHTEIVDDLLFTLGGNM